MEVEYRKKANEMNWHCHEKCSQWPFENYIAINTPPGSSYICDECIAKRHDDALVSLPER